MTSLVRPVSKLCKRPRSKNDYEPNCGDVQCIPSYVEIPVKKAKQSNEKGCEYDLLAALEHQKKMHLKLMHRALQYRAGVGLYKRKMQQFHESLNEVEQTAFRAMSNLRQSENFGKSRKFRK